MRSIEGAELSFVLGKKMSQDILDATLKSNEKLKCDLQSHFP